MTACKPKYNTAMQDPVSVTIAADQVINIDFDQISDDVIENLSDDAQTYAFVKDLQISGTNDPKQVNITVEIMDDVSDDAIKLFMSDVLTQISQEACVQDSRYTEPSADGLGSFYDSYAIHYEIKQGDADYENQTISAGESIPFGTVVSE
ncbi:hypothetical protein ACTNEN_05300 [Oribacterium sp. HCP28S3_H8]|uniref:hypothetical protein n=1 Tax=Oribacterium sp. HCP28S3_H8 TaxID=3438945 RepID=UPI003F88A177